LHQFQAAFIASFILMILIIDGISIAILSDNSSLSISILDQVGKAEKGSLLSFKSRLHCKIEK